MKPCALPESTSMCEGDGATAVGMYVVLLQLIATLVEKELNDADVIV